MRAADTNEGTSIGGTNLDGCHLMHALMYVVRHGQMVVGHIRHEDETRKQ